MSAQVKSLMPALRYEMYRDDNPEFKAVIRRMLKLGYKVSIVHIERDHQQSQLIGNALKPL